MNGLSMLPAGFPRLLQGWYPTHMETLAVGLAASGSLGALRVCAFPDKVALAARLDAMGVHVPSGVGLDIKGVLGNFNDLLDVAEKKRVAFLAHGAQLKEELRRRLQDCQIPRLAFVESLDDAIAAARDGAHALVVAGEQALRERIAEIRKRVSLPLFADVKGSLEEAQDLLAQEGVEGIRVRSPRLLKEGVESQAPGFPSELRSQLGDAAYQNLLVQEAPPLPPLRIRNLELTYPIIQGGMGIGVSWEHLAGAVAQTGCVGIVSAIGTGYRHPELAEYREGRPFQSSGLNCSSALRKILQEAIRIAGGRGAIGVNILCAINDYEHVVRESVAGGAQLIISGAGLPLSLPEYVGDADVALVPIVSSARALKLICKTWQRRFNRLPDAVVLEGPQSGGHQGFSEAECEDPAFALENLLPPVLQERDAWGQFPIIVAGGIWDRSHIDRFLALGAGGVQMGTRFIGTFECDADLAFKEILLQAKPEDIQLMKSPVGMPARGVRTQLQQAIETGSAPKIRCISNCVSPCNHGTGAVKAGYCIADRLGDAHAGLRETGLFFSGSNGWRLQDYLPVRELVEELTQDFGSTRS